jgi:hypothetical protein
VTAHVAPCVALFFGGGVLISALSFDLVAAGGAMRSQDDLDADQPPEELSR